MSHMSKLLSASCAFAISCGVFSGDLFAVGSFADQTGELSDSRIVTKRTIMLNGTDVEVTNHLDIVGAKPLHDQNIKGQGAKAIILDDHVQADHQDLFDKFTASIIPGTFVPGDMSEGHGTHVAGIIGGRTVGIAPETTLKFLSLSDDEGNITSGRLYKALEEAADSKGDVVNICCSLGIVNSQLREALQKVADSGKVIVVSMGNFYHYLPDLAKYESQELMKLAEEMKGMLVLVTNTKYGANGLERLSRHSGRAMWDSPHVISAPGSKIISTVLENKLGIKSGTSMSTPVVSGAICLLKSAFPEFSSKECLDLLLETARKESLNGSYLFPQEYGQGVIQVDKAFEAALIKRLRSTAQPEVLAPTKEKAAPKADAKFTENLLTAPIQAVKVQPAVSAPIVEEVKQNNINNDFYGDLLQARMGSVEVQPVVSAPIKEVVKQPKPYEDFNRDLLQARIEPVKVQPAVTAATKEDSNLEGSIFDWEVINPALLQGCLDRDPVKVQPEVSVAIKKKEVKSEDPSSDWTMIDDQDLLEGRIEREPVKPAQESKDGYAARFTSYLGEVISRPVSKWFW